MPILYLHFYISNIFTILESVKHFTELDIKQGKLFEFSYLINLIKNSDKFNKIPSHHVTFFVALPPFNFIGHVTHQSFTGLMTHQSSTGLMTQQSLNLIGHMTQHNFIDYTTQQTFIGHTTQQTFIGLMTQQSFIGHMTQTQQSLSVARSPVSVLEVLN